MDFWVRLCLSSVKRTRVYAYIRISRELGRKPRDLSKYPKNFETLLVYFVSFDILHLRTSPVLKSDVFRFAERSFRVTDLRILSPSVHNLEAKKDEELKCRELLVKLGLRSV